MARKAGFWVMTVLATLVGAYALASALAPGLRTPFVSDLFLARALRTFGHLGAGSVAIIAGALQFSTRLRFGSPHVHRIAGRVYVVAVLLSGTAGVLLAPWSTGGITAHFGFGLLGVFWVTSALLAWQRALQRDYAAHRMWMIRSYALCLAAVTLRLYLPISQIAGVPFEAAYPAISWLCWVPNLVVADWLVVPGSLAPLDPTAQAG